MKYLLIIIISCFIIGCSSQPPAYNSSTTPVVSTNELIIKDVTVINITNDEVLITKNGASRILVFGQRCLNYYGDGRCSNRSTYRLEELGKLYIGARFDYVVHKDNQAFPNKIILNSTEFKGEPYIKQ